MEIILLNVGKTSTKWINQGIDIYVERLKYYIKYKNIEVPDIKNAGKLNQQQQKTEEGKLILKNISKEDYVILLDEKGKMMDSVENSEYLQNIFNKSFKRLVYVIGGPFGFSKEVYDRADTMLSLSKMTFPHEFVKLIFLEQLYRAMTIIKGESYHHI